MGQERKVLQSDSDYIDGPVINPSSEAGGNDNQSEGDEHIDLVAAFHHDNDQRERVSSVPTQNGS